MEQRQLGRQGLVVSVIGLGRMGMSEFYGTTDEKEFVATIHRALELGIKLFRYRRCVAKAYFFGGQSAADRRLQILI